MEREKRERRYVGIDLGKRDYTMAIIGVDGKVRFHCGKTCISGRKAMYRLLKETDKVALEAGNLAFIVAREIQERVGSTVRVLNAAKLRYIWDAPTKTDKEDALKLAHLVEDRRDEKLPIVPLPSEKELARRKVVASYDRAMRHRVQHINTLHALFVHHGYTGIVRSDLATDSCRREAIKVLSGHEREEAEWILKYLELVDARLKELKKNVNAEAKEDKSMIVLQSIPGIGQTIAYCFVAYVGDGSRFSKGSQVSNYLGFVPRLDYSGMTKRQGHISKRGNGYLRALLVQAAWALVRSEQGGALAERYKYLTSRGASKKKVIVSIGRRMAELMYSVLRSQTMYEPRQWDGSKSA